MGEVVGRQHHAARVRRPDRGDARVVKGHHVIKAEAEAVAEVGVDYAPVAGNGNSGTNVGARNAVDRGQDARPKLRHILDVGKGVVLSHFGYRTIDLQKVIS